MKMLCTDSSKWLLLFLFFLTQNVKNQISVKIAVKYANVDKVWIVVTPRLAVSVNQAGQGRIVLSISMSDNETICGNEKVCKNLEGSYLCKCRVGFKMNGDICEGDIYHSFVHYHFIITYDLNILFRFNLHFSFKCDIIKC